MSRRELFRAAGGGCLYLYLFAGLLAAALGMAALRPEDRMALPFLVLAAFLFFWSLLAKRALLQDLLEGRTEVFRGRIAYRQNTGSLQALRVYYLVEEGDRPRKFIWFPDAAPLPPGGAAGLLSGPVSLRLLPRSRVVVRVEEFPEEVSPKHRSKAWYARREEEQMMQEAARPRPCGLREDYWFWEMTGLCLAAMAGLCAAFFPV